MRKGTAWITGASRGIGRATALRLARDGHDVAVGYHTNVDAAQETCSKIEHLNRRARPIGGDMGDVDTIALMHKEIEQHLGRVAVLVASHGVYDRRGIEEMEHADWQRTIDVNLTGAYAAARLVAPAMRDAGFGRIIMIGSIRGRTGSAHGAHYAAAKAGLLGLTRSLARELAPHGITVNLIAPGQIDTDILAGDTPQKRRERESAVPVGRLGQPQDIASAVAYLASEEAAYVTGAELRVDGGFEMG